MILCPSYREELLRTRNQSKSLVGVGMDSSPIRRNFKGLIFLTIFKPFIFAISMNHRTPAETVELNKVKGCRSGKHLKFFPFPGFHFFLTRVHMASEY